MSSIDVVESRHDALNALAAELSLRARLHNWFGVIGANDASGLLLDEERCLPWMMYILSGEILQLRHVCLDVVALHVNLLADSARVIALHLVTEEATAGALHPTGARDWQLKVKHELLKKLLSMDPGHPQIATSQEDSNALASEKVGPPFLAYLANHCIDPRVTSFALPPQLQELWSIVPRKLDTYRVALHHVKVRIGEPS